jgi:hypothetical protein
MGSAATRGHLASPLNMGAISIQAYGQNRAYVFQANRASNTMRQHRCDHGGRKPGRRGHGR